MSTDDVLLNTLHIWFWVLCLPLDSTLHSIYSWQWSLGPACSPDSLLIRYYYTQKRTEELWIFTMTCKCSTNNGVLTLSLQWTLLCKSPLVAQDGLEDRGQQAGQDDKSCLRDSWRCSAYFCCCCCWWGYTCQQFPSGSLINQTKQTIR